MIYVALAAYNEERNIGSLLEDLARLGAGEKGPLKAVIVNDGSRDRTYEVIESFRTKLDILLLDQPNRGFLPSLARALRETVGAGEDEDICVTMDADNTHPVGLIPLMVEKIGGGSDIVVCSRFKPGGGMRGVPLHRSWLSLGARFVMERSIGIPGISDYSTAFRAFRLRILKEAFERYGDRLLEGLGFSGMAGFLIRLSYLTPRIDEIPFLLRYDLKGGSSRMRIGPTLRGYLGLVLDYQRGRLRP